MVEISFLKGGSMAYFLSMVKWSMQDLNIGGVIDGWKFDIFLVDQDEAYKTKEKTEDVISLLTDERERKSYTGKTSF